MIIPLLSFGQLNDIFDFIILFLTLLRRFLADSYLSGP